MEITNKQMTSATYNIVAQDGDFRLSGKVTISDGKVKSITACKVEKNDTTLAQFGQYGDASTQVNYHTDDYDQRVQVLGKIDAFVSAVSEINQ